MPVDTSMIVSVIIGFIFGLQFGSFVTLVSFRLPAGEDIVITPSRCPSCGHRLHFHDLFPVISWLASGRACRYCNQPISARYPVIEIIAGVLAAILCVTEPPFSTAFFFRAALLLVSYCAVVMAIEKRTPPVWFYAPLAVCGTIAAFLISPYLSLPVAAYYILVATRGTNRITGAAYALPLLCIGVCYVPDVIGLILGIFGLAALYAYIISRTHITNGCAYIILCFLAIAPSSII